LTRASRVAVREVDDDDLAESRSATITRIDSVGVITLADPSGSIANAGRAKSTEASSANAGL